MTTSIHFKSITLAVVVLLSFSAFSCGSETNELFNPTIEAIHDVEYDPIFKEKPADPESTDYKYGDLTQEVGEKDATRDLEIVPQSNPEQRKGEVKESTRTIKHSKCDDC